MRNRVVTLDDLTALTESEYAESIKEINAKAEEIAELEKQLPETKVKFSTERCNLIKLLHQTDGEAAQELLHVHRHKSRFLLWFYMRYNTDRESTKSNSSNSLKMAKPIIEYGETAKEKKWKKDLFYLGLDMFSYLNSKRIKIRYRVYSGNKIEGSVAVKESYLIDIPEWYEAQLQLLDEPLTLASLQERKFCSVDDTTAPFYNAINNNSIKPFQLFDEPKPLTLASLQEKKFCSVDDTTAPFYNAINNNSIKPFQLFDEPKPLTLASLQEKKFCSVDDTTAPFYNAINNNSIKPFQLFDEPKPLTLTTLRENNFKSFDAITEPFYNAINNSFKPFNTPKSQNFLKSNIFVCSLENYFKFRQRVLPLLDSHVLANAGKRFNLLTIFRGDDVIRYNLSELFERYWKTYIVLGFRVKSAVADSNPPSDSGVKYKYSFDVGNCNKDNIAFVGYEESRKEAKCFQITGKLEAGKPLKLGQIDVTWEYIPNTGTLKLTVEEAEVYLHNFIPSEQAGGIILPNQDEVQASTTSGEVEVKIAFELDKKRKPQQIDEDPKTHEVNLSEKDGVPKPSENEDIQKEGTSQNKEPQERSPSPSSNLINFIKNITGRGTLQDGSKKNSLTYKSLDGMKYYMLVNYSGEVFETTVKADETSASATFNFDPVSEYMSSNIKLLFSFEKEDFEKKNEANTGCHDFCLLNPQTSAVTKKLERSFVINEGDLPVAQVYRTNFLNIDKTKNRDAAGTVQSGFNIAYQLRAIVPDKYKDNLCWAYKVVKISDYDYLKNSGSVISGHKDFDSDTVIEIVPNELVADKADRENLQNHADDYCLLIFAYLKDYQDKPSYDGKYGPAHCVIKCGYPKITKEMLRKVFTKVKDKDTGKNRILQEIADELNRLDNKSVPMYVTYKLDTKKRLEHFFAQCAHEASLGEIFTLEESFHYSTAKGLIDTFRYFNIHDGIRGHEKTDTIKTTEDLKEVRKAEAVEYAKIFKKKIKGYGDLYKELANKVYNIETGNKKLGNGNEASGDGWRFHGRGLIQLTGFDNYNDFNSHITQAGYGGISGKSFAGNTPESDTDRLLLVNDGKIALLSAVYFWKKNFLYTLADSDNGASDGPINKKLKDITKKINDKLKGLDDRQKNFKRINDAKIFEEFE